MVEIRPTVSSDLAQISTEPLPFRIKAMTGLVDGRVIGVAGIGYRPDGTILAFAELTEEARAHRFALHRASVKFLAGLRAQGVKRLVATADPEFAAAQRWLQRLGFVRQEDERVWVWSSKPTPTR